MSDWLSHASFLGHLGKYGQKISDPLAWVGGDKFTHLTSDVLPEKVNQGLSAVMRPFDKIDQTINPVRKIPIVNRMANITAAKPGDAMAIAAGAVFGGGALLGGGAGGGAGGAAGGAGGAGSAGAGAAGGADVGGLAALDSAAVGAEGAAPGLLGAGEVGAGGAAAGGGADVAGLAEADSNAVATQGAEPGLTQGYGSAPTEGASSSNQQFQQQQEKKRREQIAALTTIANPSFNDRQAALMVPSSRSLKTPVQVRMGDIAHAGATGADQVSQNGVQIGSIRALHKQIAQLESAARAKGYKV